MADHHNPDRVYDKSGLEEVLKIEKENLESQIESLRKKISIDQTQLRELERRISYVYGLLGQVHDSPTSSSDSFSQSDRANARKGNVIKIAKQILKDRKSEDMYYVDLAREVQAQGGDLAGKNPDQILVALLSPHPDFTRPFRKGYYALTEDHPNSKNVGERKPRRTSRN